MVQGVIVRRQLCGRLGKRPLTGATDVHQNHAMTNASLVTVDQSPQQFGAVGAIKKVEAIGAGRALAAGSHKRHDPQ